MGDDLSGLTDRARQAWNRASTVAAGRNAGEADTHDLLVGLAQSGASVANAALSRCHLDYQTLHEQAAAWREDRVGAVTPLRVGVTAMADTLRQARIFAQRGNDQLPVGTEHLLRALFFSWPFNSGSEQHAIIRAGSGPKSVLGALDDLMREGYETPLADGAWVPGTVELLPLDMDETASLGGERRRHWREAYIAALAAAQTWDKVSTLEAAHRRAAWLADHALAAFDARFVGGAGRDIALVTCEQSMWQALYINGVKAAADENLYACDALEALGVAHRSLDCALQAGQVFPERLADLETEETGEDGGGS